MLLLLVHLPESFWCGKFVQGKRYLHIPFGNVLVVKYKAVTIGGKHKRNIHHAGILESLLHSISHGVIVVLGFNNGNRLVGLGKQDIISP